MTKTILILTILLSVFYSESCAQKTNLDISFGTLYAGYKSENPSLAQGNVYRWGAWASLTHPFKLNKLFHLDVGLTYQERMPFEFFSFEAPPQSGVYTEPKIANYPTNPQHKFFKSDGFTRFPNFKYMDIEVIPTITLGNKESFSVSLGVGFFGGFLLNKNTVTRNLSDFPDIRGWLALYGVAEDYQILYHKYDFGWIPKIMFQYSLNEKASIGIQFKSYQSLIRLNDSTVNPARNFNMFWAAYAGGLSFQYRFKNKLN